MPVAHRRHVIQPGRLALQRRHEVQRVDERFVPAVPAPVLGHHLAPMHDRDAIDVCLDRHLRESRRVRHAVSVGLEHRSLVLVHQGRSFDAGVKGAGGKLQCRRLFQLEVHADGWRLMRDGAIPLGHAEGQQLPVQVRQIIGLGDWRAGPALQREHRSLHIALLLPLGRHAEQRVKPVMRRQGGIRRIERPLPATQDLDRHRLGIVPPDLPRHGGEELKRPAHPLQDRFDPLAGQRDQKRAIAVGPHPTEHIDRPPAIGEVHLHLPEVELHPPARGMVQTHECLAAGLTQRGDVSPDRVITPLIAMLGFEPLVDALGVMPLLLRGRFILTQNLPDDRHERTELGITHRLGPRIGQWLAGLRPDRATDRFLAMTQPLCDRANRFTGRVRFTNLKIIQHR